MIFYDRQGKPHKPSGINLAARRSFECSVKRPHLPVYPENRSTRRKKRNYAKGATLWENRKVPYKLDESFSQEMKDKILWAFKIFKELTCVQFEKYESENEPYIHLTHR
ncbi:uncharacterized protein LOC134277254 [Saccostrea cucullata]|uniref:uncharacterized protein LOC134277254 n=1 Tax=Saccostrea cuccullata TaxID=36930 RepID=UPI002ED58EE8